MTAPRSRLATRAAITTSAAAVLAAAWYGLEAAFGRQPPVPREILLSAAAICLVLLTIIGVLALIETRAMRRTQQRMRAFLADASHELRTPITAVQASAETLLRASPSPAQREKLTLQILRDVHRAGRLIDDLLALTRLEQGIPLAAEPVDLVPLAAAAADRTRELAPALTVTLHAPAHSRLRGDPARLRQVLDNLLDNARHATPPGGRITVRISNRRDTAEVEITDTGPGVPPADRERIFDRFTRLPGTCPRGPHDTAPDGNGLGLAIARSIAAAHHGALTCTEPAHRGARFLLQLPRPAAPNHKPTPTTPAATWTAPPGR
jgi:two-component system, OmpR family, sensor kinase